MVGTIQQKISALEKKVGTQARSPLFAQLAHYYLEANRAQDALTLCDKGLALFPFYTTGHLVKGKVLLKLNMQAEARREFEFVHEYFPTNEALKKLLEEIPETGEIVLGAPPSQAQEEKLKPGFEVPFETPSAVPTTPSFAATPSAEPSAEFSFTPQPLPAEPAQSETSFFETIKQEPTTPSVSDAFGLGETPPAVEAPAAPGPFATTEPSPFGDFSIPAETPTSPFGIPTKEEQQPAAPISEEETFEQFALRKRAELSGENTISLDEFLNPLEAAVQETPAFEPMPTIEQPTEPPVQEEKKDQIEELAEKLQDAGRITPVINFAQKEITPASEEDTLSNMGFVTPTLAEIYAKQGWYDDAIKAYKTLARTKPAERERFEKRVQELEELKKQQQP